MHTHIFSIFMTQDSGSVPILQLQFLSAVSSRFRIKRFYRLQNVRHLHRLFTPNVRFQPVAVQRVWIAVGRQMGIKECFMHRATARVALV